MLRNLLLSATLAFASTSVFAQPVLKSAEINPVIGDAFAVKVYNGSATVMPGSAGASITWDFTSVLTSSTPDTGRAVNCLTTTPTCADYPGSNLVIIGPNVSAHARNYIATSSTKLQQVGAYVAADTFLKMTNPADQLRFDMIYNQSYVDTFSGVLKYGIFPSGHHDGTITVKYDAYGTLILPGRTDNNVIRIKSVQDFTDSAHIFSTSYIKQFTITSYDWYKPNTHSPILTIQSMVEIGGPTNESFVAWAVGPVSSVNDVETGIGEVSLFPNPASGSFSLAFNLSSQEEVRATLSDLLGREVAVIGEGRLSGKNNMIFDTQGLAPGVYVVKIQAGEQLVSRKLVVE